MYLTDFKVDAILKPAKSGASEAKASSNTIHVTANTGTVTINDVGVRDNNICTASWTHSGKVDDVQFTFGTESGTKGASDSAEVRIDPWQSCPAITVTPRFKGQGGTSESKKHEYTYKTKPAMDASKFALAWSQNDRDKLTVISNNPVNSYGQSVSYQLEIDGKSYPYDQNMGEITVEESTNDHAHWKLTATINGTDLSESITGQINMSPNRKPKPEPAPTPSPSEPEPSPSHSGEAQPSAFLERGIRPYTQRAVVPGRHTVLFL